MDLDVSDEVAVQVRSGVRKVFVHSQGYHEVFDPHGLESVEKLLVIEEENDEVLFAEQRMLAVRLGVPRDISKVAPRHAPVEFLVNPLLEPREMLAEGGSALDSVDGAEDRDDPVVFRGLEICCR